MESAGGGHDVSTWKAYIPQQGPGAADMGSAGGRTTPHNDRNTITETLCGPKPIRGDTGALERDRSPQGTLTRHQRVFYI